MDIGAVVLHKILSEKSLDAWSKVKLSYFNAAYTSIYSAINRHYTKYGHLPNFDELDLLTRDQGLKRSLAALRTLEIPDVDMESCIEALVNQFAQNETLRMLDKFIDKITVLDTEEIKDEIASILMVLDEKTLPTDKVYKVNDICIFQSEEQSLHASFPLGINNTFDSTLGGGYRQELFLLGGKRGHGKSIVCSNICVSQYLQNSVSVYFTIEMTAQEVNMRNLGIIAGVSASSIKKNVYTDEEVLKLAKAKAGMFVDSDKVYQDFVEHQDRFLFETELNKLDPHPDKGIIIVDDRELSLTSIDLHLQKLKAQYGDKLTVACVDYVNQIRITGNSDMYDWKAQITISKELKNLARKHDIFIFSPLQIDDNSQVRYAKGILDATDIYAELDAYDREDGVMGFSMKKIRGGPPVHFASGITWDTLKISPADVPIPSPKEKPSKKSSKKEEKDDDKPIEGANDVPWD